MAPGIGTPAGSSAAVALDDVHKSYGAVPALRGLSLQVQPSEIVALLGPNGAGKSTTIRLLLGFERADRGRVQSAGLDAAVDPVGVRQRTAYIPELVNLYPTLSGLENLEYFCALGGQQPARERLREQLLAAGLPAEAIDRRAAEYSKGMRQKVGIAVALAKEAAVLLLDEPTSGLDPSAAADFHRTLVTVAERGVAVLMATHDLFAAQQAANRVAILSAGELVDQREVSGLTTRALESVYLDVIQQRVA
ncbi:MAG: ABC transporter ATP-binding protein [Steroidobacteraceae bacterium]|jgi:ABC-2 type transport system ATP-binding protein|nr:ABC transporter ATP-binding protein [Steroidobacteraceae bacterium]